jgi:hypothetical protein
MGGNLVAHIEGGTQAENKVLEKIFGLMRDDVQGSGEKYIMRSLMICSPRPILFG